MIWLSGCYFILKSYNKKLHILILLTRAATYKVEKHLEIGSYSNHKIVRGDYFAYKLRHFTRACNSVVRRKDVIETCVIRKHTHVIEIRTGLYDPNRFTTAIRTRCNFDTRRERRVKGEKTMNIPTQLVLSERRRVKTARWHVAHVRDVFDK